jgi:SAM-dependent methyltransferase
MIGSVYALFDLLCQQHGARGNVLEVGAMPQADTLLTLPSLQACTMRVGVNAELAGSVAGGAILRGDGHHLSMFADDTFDVVLSNATLEHDPAFWLTLQAMRRVLKAGGLLIIGVPGYGAPRNPARRVAARVGRAWGSLPLAAPLQAFGAGTPTLVPHDFPGDYYRFSAQAMREVLLAGTEVLTVASVAMPPRLVGAGRRHLGR